ncbi:SDR family oxidoreductase [Maribacter aestuarii]|uniref:SDR family oxidoreductase n=1 Tax=Maribacter aestuarii TaxID=1130723 RepID=UPI00248C99BE|nr:SDR family oxidoreductase [Maribacter aestuarii]
MKREIILITGGSSGIGKAIGVFLTSKGFTVYGTTRNLAKYHDFSHFQLLSMDVRNPESIQAAVDILIEKEGRLDVVVNNAGIGITGPLEETPQTEILKAFDTNFNGPLNVVKAVLPQMRLQNHGLIINITSIAGYMGLPFRGIYCATKGALEIITESFRLETKAFGIHFTCLAPGDFSTNIASGRYHSPVQANSPYREVYKRTLSAIDEDVDNGGNPLEVAKKILQIIHTKNPKVHYKVGSFLQRFSIVLKRILPDKVYEKLLLKHSGM